MTDSPTNVPTFLTKLQEARRLAEAARWQLLDVVIWLNEIEANHLAVRQVGVEIGTGSFDLEDDNHEDYEPGDSVELRP